MNKNELQSIIEKQKEALKSTPNQGSETSSQQEPLKGFEQKTTESVGEKIDENSDRQIQTSSTKEDDAGFITTAWFKHYDKKLDRMEALLESSYQALNHLRWMFFALFMILFVIPFLGWFGYTMGNFSW